MLNCVLFIFFYYYISFEMETPVCTAYTYTQSEIAIGRQRLFTRFRSTHGTYTQIRSYATPAI